MNNQIGVYFSANDRVYDWALAFLNSFHTFNPNLRLILIPFNDDCQRLLKLQDTYGFEIYTDPSFQQLEAIGQAFELGHTATGPYWFRRYASFWGPLDRFMYLDARQLVLGNLQPLIAALDHYGFDFLHYECAIDQVYQPGTFRQELLRQGRARGFNSGRWASKKDLFSLSEFQQLADSALKIRDQLNPRNTDQAFINYCCDLKPVVYGHFAEVIGGLCQNAWARQPGSLYQVDNQYRLWDYGGTDHRKQIVLLHWAGYQLTDPIPHRQLLLLFMYRHSKAQRLLSFWQLVFLVPGFTARWLISRRLINTLYHSLKAKNKS